MLHVVLFYFLKLSKMSENISIEQIKSVSPSLPKLLQLNARKTIEILSEFPRAPVCLWGGRHKLVLLSLDLSLPRQIPWIGKCHYIFDICYLNTIKHSCLDINFRPCARTYRHTRSAEIKTLLNSPGLSLLRNLISPTCSAHCFFFSFPRIMQMVG